MAEVLYCKILYGNLWLFCVVTHTIFKFCLSMFVKAYLKHTVCLLVHPLKRDLERVLLKPEIHLMYEQFDIFLQRKSHQLENSCVFGVLIKNLEKQWNKMMYNLGHMLFIACNLQNNIFWFRLLFSLRSNENIKNSIFNYLTHLVTA